MSGVVSVSKDLRSGVDGAVFARSGATGASAPSRASGRADFAGVLGRMQKGAEEDDAGYARRSAEQFVAMTLVQPILKQMRENNHTAAPFGPTDGEKQFQGLMDAELAQRIVRSAQFPLVDRVAGQLMERAQRASSGQSRADGSGSEEVSR